MSSQALLENMEKGTTPGRRVVIQEDGGVERRGIVVFETDEAYADIDSRLAGSSTQAGKNTNTPDVLHLLKFVFTFFAGLCILLPVFLVITIKWCMWLFSFFPELSDI